MKCIVEGASSWDSFAIFNLVKLLNLSVSSTNLERLGALSNYPGIIYQGVSDSALIRPLQTEVVKWVPIIIWFSKLLFRLL